MSLNFRARQSNPPLAPLLQDPVTASPPAAGQIAMECSSADDSEFCREVLEAIPDLVYVYDLIQQRPIFINRRLNELLGYSVQQIQNLGDNPLHQLIHPEDLPNFKEHLQKIAATQNSETLEVEYRICTHRGEWRWFASRNRLFKRRADGTPLQLLGIAQDVTLRKQAENLLQQQAENERLRGSLAQLSAGFARHIRQSLDLKQILHATVTEIQQILRADRVLIYRTYEDGVGNVLIEALADGSPGILGLKLPAEIFPQDCYDLYRNGRIRAVSDIEQDTLSTCLVETLRQLGVKAKLVVPIMQQETLWGLLIAHQCSAPRSWNPWEMELMSQLAGQVEIAIYQSELYQQVQRLNVDLERQIQIRTAQLQLAFNFEATLKRITDKVRDSLDEDQILQAAVQELATVLGVSCCNAAIYDLEQGTSTVRYEYTTTVSPSHGRVALLSAYSEIYDPLLQGQCVQFCSVMPNPVRGHVAMLATPIFDDQGVLGDLWLINHKYYAFSDQDIRMAQQVANQCAIAIRQARLYQASQTQVKALEKLNQLKDDFLSTVSHELRTPMSNIKMAIQMLEIFLKQAGVLESESSRIVRYFKILHEESQREINLINDLLDLSRLDAGAEPLNPSLIDLKSWLLPIMQPFEERTRSHQQQLLLNLPEDLPAIATDASKLERIMTELLTNACKYTPGGETIHLSAWVQNLEPHRQSPPRDVKQVSSIPASMLIRICNTGVAIPAAERDRIFEKFYRIPNNDPWQYGGTGLGLALVKKLVEHMQGTIEIEGCPDQTCFLIELPLNLRIEKRER